jgi:hypothetical protein
MAATQRLRPDRRGFLRGLLVGGGAAVALGAYAGRGRAQESGNVVLDGLTGGWEGRFPATLEGEENPTLTLRAGETYAIVWENVDGIQHNFAIEDEDGEQAMLVRFLLAHGSHQARTPVWAQLVAQLNGLMFTPHISLLGYVSDMAYDWSGIDENADARQLPETEYHIGGRRYMITAHDCRREPPPEWARNCVERILRDGRTPELQPTEAVLLDKPDFADAVLQALDSFHDEPALTENPLLRSPMLRRYSTRRDTASLRSLLRETNAQQLAGRWRQCTLHDVLDRVNFRPAAKQQAAADELHVSERKLRRRLREARTRLIAAL